MHHHPCHFKSQTLLTPAPDGFFEKEKRVKNGRTWAYKRNRREGSYMDKDDGGGLDSSRLVLFAGDNIYNQ